jgi:hypothetical protein
MKITGNILKLENENLSEVNYKLPLGEENLHLNPLIGKKIKIEFDGTINCIHSGKKIKKTYGEGYSYEAFIKLAACDICIVKPELCHFAKGTCREPEWGQKHCFQPHYIYLANTSHLKVGITREENIPYRWMDQGAIEALPIIKVQDRFTAGKIEVHLAEQLNDKTDWRKMLKNENEVINLFEEAASLLKWFKIHPLDEKYEILEPKIYKFYYPVLEYPKKINSLSLDKNPIIEGKLMGIKGQYLLLDCGVLNIRKHQGYKISLTH